MRQGKGKGGARKGLPTRAHIPLGARAPTYSAAAAAPPPPLPLARPPGNGGAYMLCMLATVVSSSTFNYLSNRYGWATSSTHAIIGALVGVGIASQAGVNWGWAIKYGPNGEVLSQSGLASVVASFFISPLLAGLIAALVFGLVKFVVLRRGGERSFLWALRSAPFWYALVAGFEAWLITWKSPRFPNTSDNDTIAIFFGTFGIVGLLTFMFISPFVYRGIWLGWAGLQLYHLPLMILTDTCIESIAPGIQRREVWFDDRHLTGIPVPVEETWFWSEDDLVAIARKRGVIPPKKYVRYIKHKDGSQTVVDIEQANIAAIKEADEAHHGITEHHVGTHHKVTVEGAAPVAAASAPELPPGVTVDGGVSVDSAALAPLKSQAYVTSGSTALSAAATVSGAHPGYMPLKKSIAEAVSYMDEEGKPLSGWKQRQAEYKENWAKASFLGRVQLFLIFWFFIGTDREIADWHLEQDTQITFQHDSDVAERYYGKTEAVFRALQVLTSSLASLAHGANDVALSVGPLSALYYYWYNGGSAKFPSNTSVLDWQLAVGALSLVLGLWFYGYNMMRVLGNRLCFHSPSRGFSMEMGAAITVLIAARNGIPVSTTNCIVGATMGVGLMNAKLHAVNWKLFGTTFFLWCITLPFCAILSGCIYASEWRRAGAVNARHPATHTVHWMSLPSASLSALLCSAQPPPPPPPSPPSRSHRLLAEAELRPDVAQDSDGQHREHHHQWRHDDDHKRQQAAVPARLPVRRPACRGRFCGFSAGSRAEPLLAVPIDISFHYHPPFLLSLRNDEAT